LIPLQSSSEDEMPAIASKSVVFTPAVFKGLDAVFSAFLTSALASLSIRTGHLWPNLAAIVTAVRNANSASQMELGQNRACKTNARIFTDSKGKAYLTPMDIPTGAKGHLKSGYFSLIANVTQGNRKTTIPTDFVQYLADCSGLSVETINRAIAEDSALSTVAVSASPVKPESGVTIGAAIKAQSPVKATDAVKASSQPKQSNGPVTVRQASPADIAKARKTNGL
jgi:hypothetical protein